MLSLPLAGDFPGARRAVLGLCQALTAAGELPRHSSVLKELRPVPRAPATSCSAQPRPHSAQPRSCSAQPQPPLCPAEAPQRESSTKPQPVFPLLHNVVQKE